jgi:hypothetical protein
MRYIAFFAPAVFCGLIAGAPAAAQSRDIRTCLAWDVHITTQIEDFGASRTLPAEALAKATLMQLEARALCAAGRAEHGVRLYERIDLLFSGAH